MSFISEYYTNGQNMNRFRNYTVNRFSNNGDKIESDARSILIPEGTLAEDAAYGAALNAFKVNFKVSYSIDQATLAANVYRNMIQGHLEN
ncbi:hypothetical protein Lpp221_07226 [Lacticaseibacillus paracasei subsp. paracasei Lpp221]|uniref:Uncharacterized protein n=2 Tax=Lacticaseibacillus paracasei TaxID=1597 RepID=A0A829GV10_LACPA|nr:hypothetical protein [Lacticaseibacillus paracasei]EPC79231.1 hypothetical protein Lpp221_07226 [Lacticaseibacillus paracasei subsp. paracasei Lpp221]EPC86432.1 hypothetical protein Lpp126_02592 [Lacticaseibacillus paracasei subsp. paracasei Lpp126]EPC64434.1 hypothetical protein Lpl14_09795 [Lacticaseibacillus paracasei subsp. tolerans Lpl14]MBU5326081.1 glycosyl hydrolase family 25 [Lacticaseibacillus paracasei]MCP9309264.1 glycosyl hydrolase family 25 [Lacticaseibacillus paracasei]